VDLIGIVRLLRVDLRLSVSAIGARLYREHRCGSRSHAKHTRDHHDRQV